MERGYITNVIIEPSEVMYGKNRLFQHSTLTKGSEVAYHEHHGDGEVYYILTGEGEFNDNGTVTTVKPGTHAGPATVKATASSA